MKPKILPLLSLFALTSCGVPSASSSEPDFSIPDSGFFEASFNLELHLQEGEQARYTLDGSEPSSSSPLYVSPVIIDDASLKENRYASHADISPTPCFVPESPVPKGTQFRAKVFKDGQTVRDYDRIYFVGEEVARAAKNLPVICLRVAEDDLFDYEKGIYVKGKAYDEGEETVYPEQHDANYNRHGKEWERGVRIDYFDDSHKPAFTQQAGIRIHGGWSRSHNQKSFNLYARKDYSGTSTFEAPLFGDIKPHTFMLRNGGYRDTYSTKCRDVLNQDLSQGLGFETQRSFPVATFLNGEYWGIYNLQERYSEHFLSEHYGINKNNVMIVQEDEIDEGLDSDIAYYKELKHLFEEGEFVTPEGYALAEEAVDLEGFAHYMAAELYCGNIDWPKNNCRLYRSREKGSHENEDGRWRFMMYDTDDSASMLSHMCGADKDPFLPNYHWASGPLENTCLIGVMFSKLLQNEVFKNRFIEAIKTVENRYSAGNVRDYLQSKSEILNEAMPEFYERFCGEEVDRFESELSVVEAFYDERKEHMDRFIEDHILDL